MDLKRTGRTFTNQYVRCTKGNVPPRPRKGLGGSFHPWGRAICCYRYSRYTNDPVPLLNPLPAQLHTRRKGQSPLLKSYCFSVPCSKHRKAERLVHKALVGSRCNDHQFVTRCCTFGPAFAHVLRQVVMGTIRTANRASFHLKTHPASLGAGEAHFRGITFRGVPPEYATSACKIIVTRMAFERPPVAPVENS